MKRKNKILLTILIFIAIFAGLVTFTYNPMNLPDNGLPLNENTTIIGQNSNGTVYKVLSGNQSSNDTVILILGVHSLESGIHNATYEAVLDFSKENLLNKNYVMYFIKLNFKDSGMNTSDYDTNRHMGELLAHEYVLPDIEKYNPFVIVDVHEMENYWDLQRYVGILDNNSAIEKEYAGKIGENLSYPVYPIRAGTSPEWVTIPLEKKNNNVLLFETAQADTQHNKTLTARDMVRVIDTFTVY